MDISISLWARETLAAYKKQRRFELLIKLYEALRGLEAGGIGVLPDGY